MRNQLLRLLAATSFTALLLALVPTITPSRAQSDLPNEVARIPAPTIRNVTINPGLRQLYGFFNGQRADGIQRFDLGSNQSLGYTYVDGRYYLQASAVNTATNDVLYGGFYITGPTTMAPFLEVMNGATGSLRGITLTGLAGEGVYGVQINSATGRVYALVREDVTLNSQLGTNLSVFDGFTLTRTIDIPGTWGSATLDPERKVLYGGSESEMGTTSSPVDYQGFLQTVNEETLAMSTVQPLDVEVLDIQVDAATGKLFVAGLSSENTLELVVMTPELQPEAQYVIATNISPGSVIDMEVLGGIGRVYVGVRNYASNSGQVIVINSDRRQVIGTLNILADSIAVDPLTRRLYVANDRNEVVVYQDPAQQLDIAVGFTVDSYRERGQCYDVIVTLRNNTEAPITRNISLSEQATYLNNEGQPAPLLTGRTDRYFDCDTGMALAVNGTINRSLTIPANSTAQLRLRLRHDWDWIERRTVTSSIYGVLSDRILDALVDMGLKGSDLAWVIESAQLYEDFGKLFYEKHGVRPRALYRYTLQVEGLDARPHRDVEVVVNEFQQGWFRGSFAAAVHANISCLFWYNPLVAPGCALAISTAETLYLAAYGEVALTAAPSLASTYTELVIPQPLTLSVLNQISDPGQRAYVENHIQAEALQRAALESLRRSTAATMAGDGAWALRQRQHAQHLLQQAAAQLGAASRQAATLVAGLTPPTAAEIAAYQAALERDGFDATTRTIFVDVGVAAADQEALRADLLTLAPEDWPELSVLPTALSAYERSVAELASTAPTVFLPLVRR